MTWMGVWTRAVIGPAARRALGTWVGCAIVGAVIFGPTGMQPHDLTELALHRSGVAVVLGLAWLLLFIPTARLLVRPDGVTYLRSLPAPRVAPVVVAALALIALQLPWLVLWLVGEHALGLAIVGGLSAVIAGLAAVQIPRVTPAPPRWRTSVGALFAVYRRAIVRRASDALLRGVGLAILTGAFAGLLVRNNAATGEHAAILAGCAIAIGLVPACAGAMLPIIDGRRSATWLAMSLGISRNRQVLAVALAVGAIELLGSAVALCATILISVSDLRTAGWMMIVTLAMSLAVTAITTRTMIRDLGSRGAAAAQVVVAMLGGTALAVVGAVWLG